MNKKDNQQSSSTLDKLQEALIEDAEKKKKNKPKYDFNKLKMYFGEDYEVIPNVVVSMPTIGDIMEVGEDKFYQSISPFIYNSTSIRLILWENKIDWCKIKDIEVFDMLIKTVDKDILKLLFKKISFDDFKLFNYKQHEEDEESQLALFSSSQSLFIPESDFTKLAEYIRTIVNSHPKVEKAKGKTAKSWMIQEDKMNALQKKDEDKSILLPMISTCLNHPGFKYKLSELKEVGIYQFMDSVQRLNVYEATRALMGGKFSGFCDTSKIPKEEFNFFRNID